LVNNGYEVENQIIVPIRYGNMTIDADLRLDLLVNDTIVVELKSVETLHPVYEAQLLTYMKLLQKPQGLLINFFTDNITKSSKPFVNEYFRQLSDE
jgi:GxxExxY protein